MKLTTKVQNSALIEAVCNATDYEFTGEISTEVPDFKVPSEPFGIGLIVGPSGSGKSTLLSALGSVETPYWSRSKAVVDHFDTFEEAHAKLGASGLNSIPAWLRPYRTLSNGEKYRADLSRQLTDGAVIDEFTSVVDRHVAKSCSVAVSKYVKREGLKSVVLASCHYDVAEWLEPDWVFDAGTGVFSDGRSLRRPAINVELIPCRTEAWSLFSKHHYLTESINKSARCWVAVWDGIAVGFASAIAQPSGTLKNAWREHRTVVLPEFQGMGIGSKISDAVGEIFISQGCRYFSKSAHPNFGLYRESSEKWKGTSKNMKSRPDYRNQRTDSKEFKRAAKHIDRVCYSHEYIG